MNRLLLGFIISSVISPAPAIVAHRQRAAAAHPLLGLVQEARPLTFSQIEALLKNLGYSDSALAQEIRKRGIAFRLTEDRLARLKSLNAGPEAIQALRKYLIKDPAPATSLPPKTAPASNKVTILVAEFDGPNPQEYRVTEHIIEQLRAATTKYADISVQALGRPVTVQQGGSETARAVGAERKATIILWGWYAANPEKASIRAYAEVVRAPKGFFLSQNNFEQIAPISELRGFNIQARLSSAMTYLTLLTVGFARYQAEDYGGAVDRFTTALNQPDLPEQLITGEIYFYRGTAYYYKADANAIDKAIADFNKAVELNPQAAAAYFSRGTSHLRKGQYDLAIADFNKVVEIIPEAAMAYYNRGLASSKKGHYDHAIADYSKTIELAPNFALAYNNRGEAYVEKKQYDHAIADLDKAIKLKRDSAEAYTNRGNAYAGKGELDRAIVDYDEAIRLNPNSAAPYNNRGYTYFEKGDFDRAIADLDKAVGLKSDYAEAYYNRGIVYVERYDYDRAIADFSKAIEFKPDDADAYANRGACYAEKHEFDRAIADCSKAIELKPYYVMAYVNRALSYQIKGELDRAIADWKSVIRITTDPDMRQLAERRLQQLGVR